MKAVEKQSTSRKGILSRFGKKIGTCVVAAILASAMCVPAAAFAINGVPTSDQSYGVQPSQEIGEGTIPRLSQGDEPYNLATATQTRVVAGCAGYRSALCDFMDILGADGVCTSGLSWGTKINISPNLFAWNDLLYTSEDEVECNQVAMDSLDEATNQDLGVGWIKFAQNGALSYAALDKYRPQVLAVESLEGNSMKAYEANVAAINEKYGAGSYNPQYAVVSSTNNIYALVDAMWNGAAAIKRVDGYGITVNARYGDPEVIAQNFENYVKATQWYILSKYEPEKKLKKVVEISSYDKDTGIAVIGNTADPTTESLDGGNYDQVTYNVAFAYDNDGVLQHDENGDVKLAEGFTKSESQSSGPGGPGGPGGGPGGGTQITTTDMSKLAACDVIFTNLDTENLNAFTTAVTNAGFKGKIKNQVTTAANQSKRGFGNVRIMAEYMGYLYPNDYKLANSLYFFWNKFVHISPEYIDEMMVAMDGECLLPNDDVTSDLAFDSDAVAYMEEMFRAGQAYYLRNKDNAASNCSNYRLTAQSTTSIEADQANNHYQFDSGVLDQYISDVKAEVEAAKAEGEKAEAEALDKLKEAEEMLKQAEASAANSMKANSMTVKAKKKTFTAKAKKKTTIKASKAFKVTGAAGKITYSKLSGNSKITVSEKGQVTVAKGLKKGKTYKVKVMVYDEGSKTVAPVAKKVTLKVKIK